MDISSNAINKLLGRDVSTETASVTDDSSATANATIESQTTSAVQHEQVNSTHEEKVQQVVEKERHQDHYHTTIQPLKDREVLPEEHDYKTTATRERSFNHEDADTTNAQLEGEKAQFINTSTTGPTAETKTKEATVVGNEHVHHHFHETVQPVIEKETVKPSVTHTTVPVHETHQEASVVHGSSVAEPMSVEEFEEKGNKVEISKY